MLIVGCERSRRAVSAAVAASLLMAAPRAQQLGHLLHSYSVLLLRRQDVRCPRGAAASHCAVTESSFLPSRFSSVTGLISSTLLIVPRLLFWTTCAPARLLRSRRRLAAESHRLSDLRTRRNSIASATSGLPRQLFARRPMCVLRAAACLNAPRTRCSDACALQQAVQHGGQGLALQPRLLRAEPARHQRCAHVRHARGGAARRGAGEAVTCCCCCGRRGGAGCSLSVAARGPGRDMCVCSILAAHA